MEHVTMLNLKEQYESLYPEIDEAIQGVLDRQHFILGSECNLFEKEMELFLEDEVYATAVSSGTDALLLALINAGIGPGDEVIVPDYSFFATVECVLRLGATPVFVDIEKDTHNIDTNEIPFRITNNTKAIIPVHMEGRVCNMLNIRDIAETYNLIIIEDAAQAVGAHYYSSLAGTIGDYGCFSFYPSKNLGAYGDAGMVITPHEGSYSRMRMLRNHGQSLKYHTRILGGSFRMDEIQAAVLRVKLKHLNDWNYVRFTKACEYIKSFREANVPVIWPKSSEHGMNIYHLFMIRSKNRDKIKQHLAENGIETEIHYPLPLHAHPVFRTYGFRDKDYPNACSAAEESLSLPIYPELPFETIYKIVELIKEVA